MYAIFDQELYHSINNNLYMGVTSLLLGTESIKPLLVSCLYNPFSPYLEAFNEITSYAFDGGLIQKWLKTFFEQNSIKKSVDLEAQVLAMEHLEIGFIFCLVPLAFSFVVFLCELSIKWLPLFFYWSVNFIVNKLIVRRFRTTLRTT